MSDILDSRELIVEATDLERALEDICLKDKSYEPERCRLKAIHDLEDEVDEVDEFRYGVTLIHEDYFPQYAKEYAADSGCMEGLDTWPAYHIDWDRAADELQSDFTSVEFMGDTYYYR